MVKKTMIGITCISVVAVFVAVGVFFLPSRKDEFSKKIKVVASFYPLAEFARQAGGDRVEVKSLARGNQDPHFLGGRPALDRGRAPAQPRAGAPRDDRDAVGRGEADQLGHLGGRRGQGNGKRQRRRQVGGLVAPVRLAVQLVGQEAEVREPFTDRGQERGLSGAGGRVGGWHARQDTGWAGPPVTGRGERIQTSATDLFVPVTWPLRCRVIGSPVSAGPQAPG